MTLGTWYLRIFSGQLSSGLLVKREVPGDQAKCHSLFVTPLKEYLYICFVFQACERSINPADVAGSTFINFGNEFEDLYAHVCSSMHAVHTSNGNLTKVNEFVCIVQDRYVRKASH